MTLVLLDELGSNPTPTVRRTSVPVNRQRYTSAEIPAVVLTHSLFLTGRFAMKRCTFLSVVILLCASTLADSQESFDWPQWQGPDRNAISKETGLARSWPAEG